MLLSQSIVFLFGSHNENELVSQTMITGLRIDYLIFT
jgi:hypothetical protein